MDFRTKSFMENIIREKASHPTLMSRIFQKQLISRLKMHHYDALSCQRSHIGCFSFYHKLSQPSFRRSPRKGKRWLHNVFLYCNQDLHFFGEARMFHLHALF
ncbi:uncharacterized protein BYT42DRAFT_237104 [Radiomyces spectabilis]|uniref:uncharacterized protein n=1 Tax=Radiomyces spectabilis TaxID=64574 RepID=UPI00221F13DD|nr:uncharacterized protein BYT42DRAFT_237104 [Radiomyces spectabilis]KAI8388496.1 hypothetical protein BYT42DRAFT_237104 [Radiomyces spectabilis]